MLRVLDVFPIGTMMSVTLEGTCEKLRNGSRLLDVNGNEIIVASVAMTRSNDPAGISKSTTIIVKQCALEKGAELSYDKTNKDNKK